MAYSKCRNITQLTENNNKKGNTMKTNDIKKGMKVKVTQLGVPVTGIMLDNMRGNTRLVDVKGSEADPLFIYLTSSRPGLMGLESIKWNFTKFLINQDGKPIERFAPNTKPETIATKIEN